jgi:hypothetical protein
VSNTGIPAGMGRSERPMRAPGAVPHAGYVCHRCNKPGHYIQDCTTDADAQAEALAAQKWQTPGIPMNYLELSSGGRLVLPTGESATLRPNRCVPKACCPSA